MQSKRSGSLPYNAGNRKHVRQAEKSSKLGEAQRCEILGYILSTPASRAWLHDLLVTCHVFHSSFTLDPYATAFNEGQRSIGLQLLADANTHPELYLILTQEAHARDIASDNNRQRGDNQDGDGGDRTAAAEGGFDLNDHRDEAGNPAFDGYEDDRS